MLKNYSIRVAAKERGVRLWEVADRLGISEPSMTRKLRRELSDNEKIELLDIIDQIAAERAE